MHSKYVDKRSQEPGAIEALRPRGLAVATARSMAETPRLLSLPGVAPRT